MPVVALYIEKRGPYFGQQRSWGNTYHYLVDDLSNDPDSDIAAQVAELEATIHRVNVELVRWQTWGPTDGPAFDNVMRQDGELDELTNRAFNEGLYQEACLLFEWPLPRSEAFNRKRWLRKFMRACTPDAELPAAVIRGEAAIPPAERTELLNEYGLPVANLTLAAGGQAQLCTADGDLPTGPGGLNEYYYTRQIGQ